jgi:hypothetical protein
MANFKAIFCWFYILGSLTMLVSASPIGTSSTALTVNTTIPLIHIYNPDFVNIEKRQKQETTWTGGCERVNVGLHNCPLMLEACRQYARQLTEGKDKWVDKWSCKTHLCVQTQGDCFHETLCNFC